ncbi:MAG: hypothetical protein ACLVIY_05040 [Anaerobutyricum soehngenii]
MAYSDDYFRYAVNDDKMISPATIVYDKYKGDFFNIHIKWGLTHLLYIAPA